MNCLPMDTRRVALAGMKYFVLSSVLVLVPCPVPFRIRLRADALELGRVFFSCCGVCMCVFVFVFLRKDNT